jgi:hypothetical protein
MIKLFIILLQIGLMFASQASHAVDINASIGLAKWTRSDNGTWWQTQFPEKWPETTNTWSLGISDKINDGLRWNVGYTNLGVIESYGEAVGDDVYSLTKECTIGPCLNPDKWYGKGSVDGVYFTLQPEVTYSNITYSFEIGVWNYQPQSMVYVPVQTAVSPARVQAYFITSSNRMWGQLLGIGAKYKQFFTHYRMFYVDSSDKDYPATYQGYTQELSIGTRF